MNDAFWDIKKLCFAAIIPIYHRSEIIYCWWL